MERPTLTLRVHPDQLHEREENEAFLDMYESRAQGYGGTIEQLSDHLAKATA